MPLTESGLLSSHTSSNKAAPVKTVLITGAAQGIGLATARLLTQIGYRVYAMVRPTSDRSLIDAVGCEVVIGDVTSSASLSSVVEQMERVDGLINNACYVVVGTCETCTIEEQMRSMDVNYFGAVRAIQEVLPRMREQRSGLIVNISSMAGYEPFPHLDAYLASKFALEGLTESLAVHCLRWGIRVAGIQPEGVKTLAPGSAALGSRAVPEYRTYCEAAKRRMRESYDNSMEPLVVAEVVRELFESDDPPLRNPVGPFAADCAQKRFCNPSGREGLAVKRDLLKDQLDLLGS